MNDLSVLMHDVLPSILIYGDMSMVSLFTIEGVILASVNFYEFFREENRVLYLFKVV